MSYCVNCGVELHKGSKRCALCDTPVVNPLDDEDDTPSPYSDVVFIPEEASGKYIAFILSVFLFIPNIICLAASFIFPAIGVWVLYFNVTSILIFMLFILP
ncbi:MAG: hypothetical protein LBH71_02100, partial [Oscillospiraceae bacterium]|nr:hypothetical protein [Oscillospiraceae bacterium]